jgi:hypothetical protein
MVDSVVLGIVLVYLQSLGVGRLQLRLLSVGFGCVVATTVTTKVGDL